MRNQTTALRSCPYSVEAAFVHTSHWHQNNSAQAEMPSFTEASLSGPPHCPCMSSANRWWVTAWWSKMSETSSAYSVNILGPSTDPCGMPCTLQWHVCLTTCHANNLSHTLLLSTFKIFTVAYSKFSIKHFGELTSLRVDQTATWLTTSWLVGAIVWDSEIFQFWVDCNSLLAQFKHNLAIGLFTI